MFSSINSIEVKMKILLYIVINIKSIEPSFVIRYHGILLFFNSLTKDININIFVSFY